MGKELTKYDYAIRGLILGFLLATLIIGLIFSFAITERNQCQEKSMKYNFTETCKIIKTGDCANLCLNTIEYALNNKLRNMSNSEDYKSSYDKCMMQCWNMFCK
jgi:hypothetical protein